MDQYSRKALYAGIALLLSLIVAAAGCGKKGDPRFTGIGRGIPAPVQDLRVHLEGGAPLLQWSGSWEDAAELRFRILRSALRRGDCIECPHEFSELAEQDGSELVREKEGGAAWRYRDSSAGTGKGYIYRVVVCDRFGNCSDPSNAVTVGR